MCRCMCRLSRSALNGEDWTEQLGGYLDIGLIDTMKDLQVNCIGAIAFSHQWLSDTGTAARASWQQRSFRLCSIPKKKKVKKMSETGNQMTSDSV